MRLVGEIVAVNTKDGKGIDVKIAAEMNREAWASLGLLAGMTCDIDFFEREPEPEAPEAPADTTGSLFDQPTSVDEAKDASGWCVHNADPNECEVCKEQEVAGETPVPVGEAS
jgi:hypothetical protein